MKQTIGRVQNGIREISVVIAAELLAISDTCVGLMVQEFPTPESVHAMYEFAQEQCQTVAQMVELAAAKARWQAELMGEPTQTVLALLEEEGFKLVGA